MANNVNIDILVQDQFSKNINLLNSLMKDAAVQAKVLDKELADAFDIGFRAKSGNLFGLKPGTIVSTQDVARLAAARRQTEDLTNSLKGYDRQLSNISNTNTRATGSFNLLRGSIAGFTAAFAVRQVSQYITEASQLAAVNQSVESSFLSLADSYGISSNRLLSDLRTTAAGYIHETDLMRVANRGLLAVGEEMARNLPRLLEISIAAAAATGEKADYVFKTLIDGISRGEPRLIDNASIYIKLGDAVEEYAASIGKSSDELDQYERRIATMNAVLAEADTFTEGLGGQNLQYARSLGEVQIALKDLKIAIGEVVQEAGLIDAVANALRDTANATQNTTGGMISLQSEFNRTDQAANPLIKSLHFIQRLLGAAPGELSEAMKDASASTADIANNAERYHAWQSAFIQALMEGNSELYYAQIQTEALDKYLSSAANSAEGIAFPLTKAQGTAGKLATEMERTADAAWNLSDASKQVDSALSGILSGLVAQKDVLSAAEITSAYSKARDQAEGFYFWLEGADEASKALYISNWKDAFLEEGVLRRESIRERERLESEAARASEQRLKSLQNTIQTVLQRGREVKPFDFALTEAGIYEDAPLENARRLQAIVERGFSELDAHPDWAGILQIPQEILTGSEIQLKQWAATTEQAVSNLADPSRINWDAFLREFQKQMEFEAGQEAVIAEAMKRLTEAGLIGGFKKADVKRQLEVAVGKKDPITSALESSMTGSNLGIFASKTWGDQFTGQESKFNDIGKSVADWIFAGYKSRLEDLVKNQGSDPFDENLPPPNDNASNGSVGGYGPLE